MPIYTSGQTGSEIITSSETQPTFNEKLSATISEAWNTSYGPKAYDFAASVIAGKNGPRLSKDQAMKQIGEAGLGAHMTADDGKYTADQLNVLIDRQKRILSAQDIGSRTDYDAGTLIRGPAAFIAGIVDPINAASAFFPATKVFQAARLGWAAKAMTALERAAVSSPTLLGRLGARAAVGAVEGAVGTAVLEPANYWLSQQLQDDYGMADSLMNLAAGAAFGGALQAGTGAIGEGVRAFRNRMATSRVAIEAAVNEQLGIPQVAPDYQVKAGSETWVRMGDNDVPAQWAVVDAKEVQARAARAVTPETVQAITQALDFTRMADAATMGEGAPVIGRNGELLAGTNRVAALDELYNTGNADGYKAPLAEKLKELGIDEAVLNEMQQPMLVRMLRQDVEPEQVAKFKDEVATEAPAPKQAGTAVETDAGAVETAAREVDQAAPQEPPAAELVARVSPETREAATKVAVGEFVEGKRPQVDALIKQDPAIAKATAEDVEADVRKANDIANEYTSDVEAARYVEKQAAKEIPDGELADIDLPRMVKEREAIAKETAELIKRIEADIDSPLYSVQRETVKATDGKPDTLPVQQLTETLRTEFGKATEALIDTGKVAVVNSIDELPGGPHPERVQAAYIGGKVYMVASNINPAKARGLLLHEVGVHAGMENMLGVDGFAKVLDQVDRLVAEDDDLARIAKASIPADTPAAHVREEMLAYLVENAPQLPLVQRIISAVKAWAYRTFGFARDSMELSGADLVQLATASLRRYARAAGEASGDTRYSQGATRSVTPATFDKEAFKKEMAVFADAEQRAEGYGQALRAAFNVAGNVDAMIQTMRQAMPEMSRTEAEQLANKFNRKVTTFQRELDDGRVPDYAIGLDPRERAAQAITDDTLYKLALEKRATVFAHRAKIKGIDLVTNNFAGVEGQGVQALLVGSNLARKGARSSVAASQQHWSNRYIGGLTTKLNEAGLYEAFVSDAFGDDIMRAMDKLERGEDVSKLAKEAVGIAKVVREFYDASVQDRNQRGTWIRKTKGYYFDQSYSHDMARIRNTGAADWKQDAMQWFDFDEMARRQDLTPRQVMTELDKMWSDFASGSHMKFTDDTQTNDLANMLGGANVAKQESKSRVIVFKDVEAAIGYFKKYGNGELKSAVYSSLDKAARQIGLMDVLGPKYETTLKAILDTAEETITDPEAKNKFHTTTKNKAEAWLEMLDGRANIPVNGTLARRAALVRGWIRLTSLGGSIFAQFSDLTNIAAELKFLGSPKGYLGNVADAVGSFARRYKGTEREAMINALGVYNEAATAAAFESSGANDLMGGMMAKASQLFFKLNLQSPWTYKLRLHMADTLMNYMGTMTKEDFGALPKHLQTMLKGYNITEREWGLLRQLDKRAIDGRNYLDPNNIDSIDAQVREMVSRELGNADAKAIDEAASRVKGNLKTALSNFYLDSVSRGMLEPDIRSRAILVGNTRPGTIQGEILRMIGQFKLFPVGAVINIMGREVYSRGFDSIGAFIRRGKGEMLGMAQYMLAATTMGYMTMMAKDLTKGRTPRDPTSPSTWTAAFIAGGAAGIYGDFIFGEYNRFGGSLTGTLAGPFFGKADDLMKLYGSARGWFTGDVDSVDFASKLLRFGINNTPMINLFYTRMALDYLFLYGLQENMNPGYLRRMERNVQQQNNQTFWLPPSQYALGVR